MLRLRGILRYGAPLTVASCLLSGCLPEDDDDPKPLSQVATVPDSPPADTTTRVNINNQSPSLTVPQTFSIADGDELTLVWSDEFDGAQLDPNIWFFATGDGAESGIPGGWGNNELQWYLPDNARLEDGKLKIEARRETVSNASGEFAYTSARINTRDRLAIKYGRIEARIKLPGGQGIWPAFWMFPQENTYGGFSASGEIDIVEAVNLGGSPGPGGFGGGNEIFGTIHFGGEAPANQSASTRFTPAEDITADFHTYAVEWGETEIRWYFDGALYAVQNAWSTTGGAYPAPFDHPFYILLNVAVGGNFPGSPNGSTQLPVTMEVDWVRVYSGEDNGGGGGTPAPATGVIPDDVIYASNPNEMVDLVFGVDYSGFDPFGSGSTFDNNVTGDSRFSPAFGVTTGDGYGAQVGQFAITGFSTGFAAAYESLVFKAKNLNNNLIRVKLLPSEPYVDIDLTNSSYSTDLGDGWYQVVVPVADLAGADAATDLLFETDNTAASSFTFLLTDFGFNTAEAGGAAITPAAVVYASDPNVTEDLPPGGFDNFGSGAVFDASVMTDADYSPAFQVTSGEGYGEGVHVGFVAFTGFSAGFASNFETLHFKIKADAANLAAFEVKFFAPDTSQTYDLTTYAGAVDLGNGWLQVSIPMSDFAENIAANDGFLVGPLGAQTAAFNYLLTDIGFDDAANVSPAITPESVVYATDPNVTVNLPPGGFDNFGSGANFDGMFAGDADFNPAFQVISGEGYGEGVHVGFVAFTGFGAGFASGFETLHFKIKADAANLAAFEVKFFAPDTTQTYDLTTYSGAVDLGNGWLQVSIPMSDFSENIAVNDGFLIGPLGAQAAPFSYLLTDIGFNSASAGSGGSGSGDSGSGGSSGSQLATNGGLEDGDFTGWAIFPNGGTATVTMDDPSSGTFSANATVAVVNGSGAAPAPPILKQESVGVGVVGTGETINISFDLKGTVSNGGFVSVEFFSERANGADLQTLDTITAPNAAWTSYGPYTPTTSDDVSRGITLQFVVICGAVDGCAADVDIDNVSITRSAQ